jgi:hypothetical protein
MNYRKGFLNLNLNEITRKYWVMWHTELIVRDNPFNVCVGDCILSTCLCWSARTLLFDFLVYFLSPVVSGSNKRIALLSSFQECRKKPLED